MNRLNAANDNLLNDPYYGKDFFLYKGLCELIKGEHTAAETNMLKSLDYCNQIGVPRFVYARYDNLASIYMGMNLQSKAIEYLHKSITLKEADGNGEALALGYIQLAQLFFGIESYEAGKRALEKAEHYIRKYKQQEHAKYLYFIQGKQQKREQKYEEAIQSYTKAAKYAAKFNDPDSQMRALHNRGEIYMRLLQWKKAETDYRNALQLAEENSLHADKPALLVSLATVLMQKQDDKGFTEAIRQLNGLITANSNKILLRDYEELLAKHYKQHEHFDKALQHYENYLLHYRDTYNQQMSNSLLDLQSKYESEKRERELQQAQLQRTESELKALRAQMNPHFIFNALNGVRNELLDGNTDLADEYIVRFSKLLRLILDSTRQPLVRLSENIEMLELYIKIEQARQSNRFSYSFTLAKDVYPNALFIPGMVLQPIVENAIVHGLYHKRSKGSWLKLHFEKTKDCLHVTIRDNGVGRSGVKKNANHRSHATSIVRETLTLAWGENFKDEYYKITDLTDAKGKPAGTAVSISLPIALKP
ncbi:MAG: histidine kinase [Chitinophagales bacterium]|nr:histidine kinase [Chitinophagales bacterium]